MKYNYKIVWDWVDVGEYGKLMKLNCLAMKSISMFDRHMFWWPLPSGWVSDRDTSLEAIEFDRNKLRLIPETEYFK